MTTPAQRMTDAEIRSQFDRLVGTITPAVMNEKQAAEYIGVTVTWLRNNRKAATTPPYLKYGGKLVRYHRDDLNKWLEDQRVS